jgi:RNA ligase
MTNYKETFDELVREGWLISQAHPTLDLTIYNYSQKTQYEKYWTQETLAARGLVLNSQGKVVALPFPKFFNAEELDPREIPKLPFEVYEKMDGSLGIFFWYADPASEKLVPVFASRGSFTSEQAVKGWELLQHLPYHDLAYGHTHLFEIIYPENRIVVNYGNEEKLVLLGIIQKDGREVPRENIEDHLGSSFELVKVYNITEDWMSLKSQNEPNREGYVIRYSNGFRMKVKFEDYVRLHRIVTCVSNLSIWEMLRTSQPFNEILERVPDEFFHWVYGVARDLAHRASNIEGDYRSYFSDICGRVPAGDRKAFAEEAKRYRHPDLLFRMLDGKDYMPAIWKIVKPAYEKPFYYNHK